MILVVSSEQDVHAQAVLRELETLREPAMVVDLSAFPSNGRMVLRSGGGGGRNHRVSFDGTGPVDLQDVRSVWWRRPQAYGMHQEIERGRHFQFSYNECFEAWTGIWQSLREDALWINDLNRDEAAHRKVYQLRIAQDVGLTIPETLITNDPEEASAFVAGYPEGGAIYKAFSATANEWRETRVVGERELALLDHVRYAPVIFQEYVDAVYDVRITVVGSEMFPAAIHSQSTRYPVDFRMDMDRARVEPVELPDPVRRGLDALMERLGLVYGAIDMRRTPDDRWVFLEINPAGQFLFIEQQTGQPIARSLARRLAFPA